MAGGQDGVTELLEKVGGQFDTSTLFGEPRMLEGTAVIPVASIRYGGGGGGGASRRAGEMGGTPAGQQPDEGSGVGFGLNAQPLGVVEVRQDVVRWVPVIDWGRLLLAWSVVTGALLLMSTVVGSRRR